MVPVEALVTVDFGAFTFLLVNFKAFRAVVFLNKNYKMLKTL
jgi:hypothetical protein